MWWGGVRLTNLIFFLTKFVKVFKVGSKNHNKVVIHICRKNAFGTEVRKICWYFNRLILYQFKNY